MLIRTPWYWVSTTMKTACFALATASGVCKKLSAGAKQREDMPANEPLEQTGYARCSAPIRYAHG